MLTRPGISCVCMLNKSGAQCASMLTRHGLSCLGSCVHPNKGWNNVMSVRGNKHLDIMSERAD
jgi:hypothetical protein